MKNSRNGFIKKTHNNQINTNSCYGQQKRRNTSRILLERVKKQRIDQYRQTRTNVIIDSKKNGRVTHINKTRRITKSIKNFSCNNPIPRQNNNSEINKCKSMNNKITSMNSSNSQISATKVSSFYKKFPIVESKNNNNKQKNQYNTSKNHRKNKNSQKFKKFKESKMLCDKQNAIKHSLDQIIPIGVSVRMNNSVVDKKCNKNNSINCNNSNGKTCKNIQSTTEIFKIVSKPFSSSNPNINIVSLRSINRRRKRTVRNKTSRATTTTIIPACDDILLTHSNNNNNNNSVTDSEDNNKKKKFINKNNNNNDSNINNRNILNKTKYSNRGKGGRFTKKSKTKNKTKTKLKQNKSNQSSNRKRNKALKSNKSVDEFLVEKCEFYDCPERFILIGKCKNKSYRNQNISKHNRLFHPNAIEKLNDNPNSSLNKLVINKNLHSCKFCGLNFYDRLSKFEHEQTFCNENENRFDQLNYSCSNSIISNSTKYFDVQDGNHIIKNGSKITLRLKKIQ